MKYAKKYPLAEHLQEIEPGIIGVNSIGKCWNCGEWTFFADIDFGARLCSEECSLRKWGEYIEASKG